MNPEFSGPVKPVGNDQHTRRPWKGRIKHYSLLPDSRILSAVRIF